MGGWTQETEEKAGAGPVNFDMGWID
jgi:hypothetical protein